MEVPKRSVFDPFSPTHHKKLPITIKRNGAMLYVDRSDSPSFSEEDDGRASPVARARAAMLTAGRRPYTADPPPRTPPRREPSFDTVKFRRSLSDYKDLKMVRPNSSHVYRPSSAVSGSGWSESVFSSASSLSGTATPQPAEAQHRSRMDNFSELTHAARGGKAPKLLTPVSAARPEKRKRRVGRQKQLERLTTDAPALSKLTAGYSYSFMQARQAQLCSLDPAVPYLRLVATFPSPSPFPPTRPTTLQAVRILPDSDPTHALLSS